MQGDIGMIRCNHKSGKQNQQEYKSNQELLGDFDYSQEIVDVGRVSASGCN